MSSNSITSANSVFMLGAQLLFPAPVKIEGYSADRAWDLNKTTHAETVLGIDGKLSMGWLPYTTTMILHIMPNSSADDLLNRIIEFQSTLREIAPLFGTLQIPAIKRKYALSDGVLTEFQQVPSASATLQPKTATIVWNLCQSSVL